MQGCRLREKYDCTKAYKKYNIKNYVCSHCNIFISRKIIKYFYLASLFCVTEKSVTEKKKKNAKVCEHQIEVMKYEFMIFYYIRELA